MDPQGGTSLRIGSLQFATEGMVDRFRHSMGCVGACKSQYSLVMVVIYCNLD